MENHQGSSNFIWAYLFADELKNSGVRDICISAGSRSTPLILAFHSIPEFTLHYIIDERSAAFFALGLAKGGNNSPVLICTSGTAVANYYPAILEAEQSNIPLIVLTADRPSELRDSGANQTLDQIKIYGDHVRFFHQFSNPPLNIQENEMFRTQSKYIRKISSYGYSIANHEANSGPVHYNFPFPKPLEPSETSDLAKLIDIIKNKESELGSNEDLPYFQQMNTYTLSEPSKSQLTAILDKTKKVLIVHGPIEYRQSTSSLIALSEFADKWNIPIFADGLSNLRYSEIQTNNIITTSSLFLSRATFLLEDPPDLIIHFGRFPVSAGFEEHLKLINPSILRVSQFKNQSDPTHQKSIHINLSSEQFIDELDILMDHSKPELDENWVNQIKEIESSYVKTLVSHLKDDNFEGSYIPHFLNMLEKDSNVFFSNSLAVRYLDYLSGTYSERLNIYGNRGLSGIDGIVSTSAGIAKIKNEHIYLVIGDLAFLHDINSIELIKRLNIKITILLLNNNGGGIFDLLPIRKFDPPYSQLFKTPIEYDFEKSLTQIVGEYYIVKTLSELKTIIKNQNSDLMIVELRTNPDFNNKYLKKIIKDPVTSE